MDELRELPPAFQNRFEKAKADAEREYATRAERFPHNPHWADYPIHHLKMVQDVLFSYCAHARDACRAGEWTVIEVRRASDTALSIICDFYSARDYGASEEEKIRFRVSFTRVVNDDAQWQLHLSELAALANAASHATTGVTGPAQAATLADKATRKRRREILQRFCSKHGWTKSALARHAGTSVTAIQGMVRGDRTRYSADTLLRFLKAIGVHPDEW